MTSFIRFAQPMVLAVAAAVVIIAVLIRLFFCRTPHYRSSLASIAKMLAIQSHHPYKKILFLIRLIMFIILVLLLGRPQLVDVRSQMHTQGINIMLVLDVSGSMQMQDYGDDERSRFEIAQDEAIRFIKARPNDAIGLVIFGRDAVSRCPLTLDKKMLEAIVTETKIGVVDPGGTVLARGMMTAANRLKNMPGKSNVMIVLTDGEPSEQDIDPRIAIEIAKQLDIKIYTIGIGSDQPRAVMTQFGPVMAPCVNKELLKYIAQQTGGKFFLARNAQDMREVYQTIDKLEKIDLEAPVFTRYYDIFMPGVWVVFLLLLLEILLSATIWFGI